MARAEYPAPDRRSRIEIASGAVRYIGTNGVPVDLALRGLTPALVEVLWAPNGRAFAINASDRSVLETWSPYVFHLDQASRPVAVDVRGLVLPQARELLASDERETPNIAAVSWAPGSFQLFVVAESAPHSAGRKTGELRGFRVSLEPLRIEAPLTEAELRTKWAGQLGPRLADHGDGDTQSWQPVRPIEVRKRIETGNAKVRVAILAATSEVPLYELRCNELDARDSAAEGGEEYFGMFQCRLWQAREADLLRAGADWEDKYTTRGVFEFEQVVGPCKSDPYFGLRRTFLLRGMRLVLEISSFESPPVADLLASRAQRHFRFDFDVSIAPDAGAAAARAPNPPGRYCNGIYVLDGSGRAVYEETKR